LLRIHIFSAREELNRIGSQIQNLLLESSPGPSGAEELRSAEDILFDYLDPEEGRIYNDLARCIRSVSQN
jgi:hypothetical protein